MGDESVGAGAVGMELVCSPAFRRHGYHALSDASQTWWQRLAVEWKMDRSGGSEQRSRSERISVESEEILDEPRQQSELSSRLETNHPKIQFGSRDNSCGGGSGV